MKRHATIFAGTSGWAYPSWKPGFYPKDVPARRFLEHYASRLSSVEVNYTFRALPKPEQLAGWMGAVADAGRAPGSFKLSFKAPEGITHRKRLRECGEAVEKFLTAIAPVREAGMLGCVLFQLPPNFKADLPRMETFLALLQLRAVPRIAFEFRNESWFTEDLYALLRAHNAAICIAESDDLRTPEVHTARDFACYRLRMAGGYDERSVAEHAAKFRTLAAHHAGGSAARELYIYYKHEDEPTGPLAAEAMLRLL